MAVAKSLKQANEEPWEGHASYFEYQRKDFANAQEILLKGLAESSLPIEPIKAEGGYFLMADISKCKDLIPEKYFKNEEFEDDADTIIEKNDFGDPVPLDLAFCRWLAMEKKVVTMPNTFFCDRKSPYKSDIYARFAICRGDDLTKEACKRLK